MWRNLRIGIIGQGSQYDRISKILKIKGIKFITYKPSRKKGYYDKKKFRELKKSNVIFILSPNDIIDLYFVKNPQLINLMI